jgi:hypothetical protein
MPIGAQPRRRTGTVERPYSALNLRLLLALVGMLSCAVLAVVLLRAGLAAPGWILVGLAVLGALDAVVVQLRRRARRGERHSLFE